MASYHLFRCARVWILFLITISFPLFAKCRRFEVYNRTSKPATVCSIVDADVTIVVTAMDGDRELISISVTSNSSDIHAFGSCGHYIMLGWPDDIHWLITNRDPYIDFSVLFTPNNVFGDIAPSAKVMSFESPRKAIVGEDRSYKCSAKNVDYYQRNSSENITFSVTVIVKYVQVQLVNVMNGTFSSPGPECNQTELPPVTPTVPSAPGSYFWRRWLKVIIPVMACITCVVICLVVWYYFRRRRRPQVWLRRYSERLV